MFKKIIIDNEETNYSVSELGEICNDKTGRVLKGTTARNEYHSVQLTIKGKPKTFMVHRLVAQAFCPNPNNYTIVDHIDSNKLNNCADNLQWVTTQENSLKATRSNKSTPMKKIDLENTIYKKIPGYENYGITEDGEVINLKLKKALNGHIRDGYKRVTVIGSDGKKTNLSVHRLVYNAFRGPIEGVIDHIDGNKLNNNLSNLRDITQSENMTNAQKNGHKGQVPVDQYDIDGNLVKTYANCSEAAQAMGVTPAAIRTAAERHGSSCGYYWIKKGEQFVKPARKPISSVIIQQFTLDGELVGEYNTYTEAGRAVGKAKQNIHDAVHKGYKTSGYKWKIKEN